MDADKATKAGKEIKPAWRAVERDETENWTIPDRFRSKVKAIHTTYFYNASEVTYLCSAEPNYFLHALHHNVAFAHDVSDAEKEIFLNWLDLTSSEDGYFPTREIDWRKTVPFPEQYVDDDLTENEVREHWQGNWPF